MRKSDLFVWQNATLTTQHLLEHSRFSTEDQLHCRINILALWYFIVMTLFWPLQISNARDCEKVIARALTLTLQKICKILIFKYLRGKRAISVFPFSTSDDGIPLYRNSSTSPPVQAFSAVFSRRRTANRASPVVCFGHYPRGVKLAWQPELPLQLL